MVEGYEKVASAARSPFWLFSRKLQLGGTSGRRSWDEVWEKRWEEFCGICWRFELALNSVDQSLNQWMSMVVYQIKITVLFFYLLELYWLENNLECLNISEDAAHSCCLARRSCTTQSKPTWNCQLRLNLTKSQSSSEVPTTFLRLSFSTHR
jgi:hypothetical protein